MARIPYSTTDGVDSGNMGELADKLLASKGCPVRTCVRITISPNNSLSTTVVNELLSMAAAGDDRLRWKHLSFEEHDPRIARVMQFCHEAGLQRMTATNIDAVRRCPDGYYKYIKYHDFSESDRSAADWLWAYDLDPDRRVVALGRTAGAELVLGRSDTPNDFDVLGGLMTLLVRAAVRDELESMRLIGLGFKPVHFGKHEFDPDPVYGKRRRTVVLPPLPGEDWSEIWPSIELPQMHAPEIRRLDTTTRAEFTSPDRGPAVFVNPGFDDGQPVYTREALRSVGPFDFARTWEYYYPLQENLRWTIISQRVYQYLIGKGVEGTYIPVKVVEG